MKQAVYFPKNPVVKQVINCMGYVEMSPEDIIEGWLGLFPNGSSNMTISLNDDPVHYHKNKGQSLIFASWTNPVALKRTKTLKFINLQFKPIGLYCLKAIPMSELQNTSLTLDVFFSRSENDELLDRIYTCQSLKAKFATIERFLSAKINPELFDDRLKLALSLIKKTDAPSMDYLSDAVCLSSRRFRELFSTHTGFSPSFYKKVVRFTRATKQMMQHQHTSLTDVALENSYYDQAHFIKDFKSFSGITPSQFLKQKSKTSDFYNFNLPDLTKFDSRG
ncbi:helix-turn-helix domain-containing protein [Fulvivirga lutimaris]|uniref:helix-turn-helix domain-containing protein n=1 Tax=Fulvivirga lutimaris TaxID=1819566 RepID=UPI0012BBAA37|nr:helix-turn-helix domain-containing protein [Fulvivirga lutimaris]MTI40891.1 AraC family transcriptional regulator [Fulvivirga lutimaris]